MERPPRSPRNPMITLEPSEVPPPYTMSHDGLSSNPPPVLLSKERRGSALGLSALHSEHQSTSTASTNSPFNIAISLDSNHLSRTTTNESQRSSSEYTAVTIYSMYSDAPRESPLVISTSPPPNIDLRVPGSRPYSNLDCPPSSRPSSSSRTSPFLGPPTTKTSLERTLAVSSQQTTHFDVSPRPQSGIITHQDPSPQPTPSPPMNRLPVPRSSQPSPSSSRPQSSLSPLTGDEEEDADSMYVRTTYARLEQSGVPGDGYEDGVERTRARSTAKIENTRRATVWGNSMADLSQKEIDFLTSLDRYGFVLSSLSKRQENRLSLLPAAPLLKHLVPDKPTRTPPSSPPTSSKEISSVPTPLVPPKERTRMAKWERMMKVSKRDQGGNIEVWTFDERKGRKLRDRVYKGVPDRWRAAVWWTLIDGATLNVMSPPNPSDGSRKMSAVDLGNQYRDWIDRPSSYDIQIDLDVPRTISGHVMFHTRYGQGQRSLFHILHSFSLICSDCGYCQGMGPIAATLLCYMDPDRAYASMVRIHDSYDMHSIFSPGFPGLLESIYVQEKMLEKLLPDVHASFTKHMISSTSYATKWYITLFANTFPFQTQLRLWDAFFLEGRDVIVITAVAIIWVLKEHLASAQASFETILSLLSSFFVPEQEDVLMTWMGKALGDKKLRADMVRWRLDWRELVKSGKDGTALL